jgi:hypothetical protein
MAANIPSDNISLPAAWRAAAPILVAVGAVCVLASSFAFNMVTPDTGVGFKAFFHSYMANYVYCLTFCLGALFFVLVQHVVRAGWSASIRRVAELFAYTIPWWAMLFIPVAVMLLSGNSSLYEWNVGKDSETLEPVVREKLMYLNSGWFTLRAVLYFAIWITAATIYFRMSREQDESGSSEITLKLQRWGGPFIILFALSLNFAAFDWIMSTDPAWFSTIFGVYLFAAGMLSFFAVMILTCYLLQRNGRLEKFVTTEHFHDMAKFQFGFIVFWAYIAFSQFMLYWYANIPEETGWYAERMNHGWGYLSAALIVLHFGLPFLGTLPRAIRRSRTALAGWACFILFVHFLDMTFLLMPNVGVPMTAPLLAAHVLGWVGMVSIFLAFFVWRVGDTPLVATRDPWLADSLAYHNF